MSRGVQKFKPFTAFVFCCFSEYIFVELHYKFKYFFTVKIVMSGEHYNRSKKGLTIFLLSLRLTLNVLKICAFFMSFRLS